ncbi:hypothetical protein SCUP515_04368 [Seiridium cupressi]
MAGNKKSEATSLWQRRVKVAMPKADKVLEGTAYSLLEATDRKVIRDAVDKLLEVAIAEAVKHLPKGERLDYDPMINQAITEAFTDHFDLFNWDVDDDPELRYLTGWDDEHCFHELFFMHGV